ncbi:MAG: GtrA family protein [Patescibacteria group bacterium]|nr:GtrA family protein [Patescibacteria group bacterium]
MTRKDILLSLSSAALIGFLALPTLNNILPAYGWGIRLGVASALLFLTLIGLASFHFISRWVKVFWQIAKFIVVGGLNTVLDFAVLNLLITLTGIAVGGGFSLFKALSFSVAVINSYFWNKHWTFEAKGKSRTEFIEFLLVSIVGVGINVGLASALVNFIDPLFGLGVVVWANLAALAATFLTLVWNFLGYKLLVFRKRT